MDFQPLLFKERLEGVAEDHYNFNVAPTKQEVTLMNNMIKKIIYESGCTLNFPTKLKRGNRITIIISHPPENLIENPIA